jgi:hypothetical protein
MGDNTIDMGENSFKDGTYHSYGKLPAKRRTGTTIVNSTTYQ